MKARLTYNKTDRMLGSLPACEDCFFDVGFDENESSTSCDLIKHKQHSHFCFHGKDDKFIGWFTIEDDTDNET